jgi:FKBP-type peptidyl-prolyl cis-trans isomerase FkpA
MARLALVFSAVLATGAVAQPADAPMRVPAPAVTEDLDRVLYALGVSLGRTLKPFALSPAELAKVEQGIRDVNSNAVKGELEDVLPRLRELEVQRRSQSMANEKERGKTYAATAAKAPGAKVFESGLVFIPVSEGVGPSPTPVDTVRVHYRGKLIDGTEFDSSYERGQPAEFRLSQVVACWTEGVQKLKVGGRAKLICPSSIAYGDRGSLPKIPPGATLVFDVELRDVVQRGSTTVH